MVLSYMDEYFPTCMYVYEVCAWCLRRLEEGVRSPGAEVVDQL